MTNTNNAAALIDYLTAMLCAAEWRHSEKPSRRTQQALDDARAELAAACGIHR